MLNFTIRARILANNMHTENKFLCGNFKVQRDLKLK